MLQIHFSNRFEVLAELIAERVSAPGDDPFTTEHIVVPSTAIRRALSLHLAQRHGISANLHFAFAAEWIWSQIAKVLTVVPTESPYAARRLGWRLYQILSEPSIATRSTRLADYLNSCNDLMRRDLAIQLGALFEQYTTYRPDWLAAWEKHQTALSGSAPASARSDEPWQAELWRALQLDIAPRCADPTQAFLDAIAGMTPSQWLKAGHPGQVQIVAPTGLPPLHARVLAGIGRVMDIHLYVINPCQEYWFDLVDARRLSHLRLRGQATGHEQGHPLLAAWGKQAQAHIGVLVEAFGDHLTDEGGYLAHPEDTLLGRFQNSILQLDPPAPRAWSTLDLDHSIEIHACHSLSRQLEALQNRLLSLFSGRTPAADPLRAADAPEPLGPADVLVVIPDLRAAVPLIEAVFGTVPEAQFLPYNITGLPETDVNPVARALLDLLGFLSGRAGVKTFIELLSQEIIRDRFKLTLAEVDLITAWLLQSGVHWGLDAQHRSAFPGAERSAHTLAHGLERLFLSYALPDDNPAPFQNRWPAGSVQGNDSIALGKLWRLSRLLSEFAHRIAAPLSAQDWQVLIDDLLGQCLNDSPREVDALLRVRAACHALFTDLSPLSTDCLLPAEVFIRSLQEALDAPSRGAIPSGSITFAAPGGLRHLPYRIIAVLGLDDGAFPGGAKPQEFDLMSTLPRLGDRQRRIDDRGLFLDLVLAAREKLILGYTAFSAHDNSPLPPSTLLCELIDVLQQALGVERYQALRVEHPLQAFDLNAFLPGTDPRARSHDPIAARAWQQALPRLASGQASDGPPPFIEPAVAAQAPPDDPQGVTLDDLIASLCNPARALLRSRARLTLRPPAAGLEELEPLVVQRAMLNRFKRHAVQRLIQAESSTALIAQGCQSPGIPQGWLGVQGVSAAVKSAARYAERLSHELSAPGLADRAIDLPLMIDGRTLRLTGQLGPLRVQGQILALEATGYAQALLTGWVRHLVLCIESPAGMVCQTQVHTFEDSFSWRPHETPAPMLSRLVALHLRILQELVPFFARSSLAVATQDEKAFASSWAPQFGGLTGESEYPEVQRAWRGQGDPTQHPEFQTLAHEVFDDLLAHLQAPALQASPRV